jgi:RNA polymerase sigma-54 factor
LKSLIGLLNFNPAQHYEHSIAQQYYQQPDLIVCKNNNKFEVHLNQDLIPSLHLDEVASYSFHQKEMKELVQQAKYLIKIVDTRFDTLIKTASLLVHHQQDFFVYGKAGLKTLILEDIAQQLGLHESTISRIIANKLIQTPLGIFELKSLLSRGLKKNSGEIVSTASVKEIILSLIQHECVSEPLSDQDIANTLNRQGFCIARRTVTKYRKQLDIQTSTQRKIH